MKTSAFMFIVCLLGWAIGLLGIGGEIVMGFSLAIGSVCFILAFITRLLEKVEATKS